MTTLARLRDMVVSNAEYGLEDVLGMVENVTSESETWDNITLPRDMTLADFEQYADEAIGEFGTDICSDFQSLKNGAGYMYGRECMGEAVEIMTDALTELED